MAGQDVPKPVKDGAKEKEEISNLPGNGDSATYGDGVARTYG